MRRLVLPISFVVYSICSLLFADLDRVLTLEPGNPFAYSFELTEPSSFIVENPRGDIEVLPAKDGNLSVSGMPNGSSEILLTYRRVSHNRIRLMVSIAGSDASVNLKVSVPPELLANLQASSKKGDVSLMNFPDPSRLDPRVVHLLSEDGEVRCSKVNAAGGIVGEVGQGRVAVSGLEASQATFEVKTGDIIAGSTTGKSLELNVFKGDVLAFNNKGSMRVRVKKKGNISVQGHSLGYIDAATTNGKVNLQNPDALGERAVAKSGKVIGARKTCAQKVADTDPLEDCFDW